MTGFSEICRRFHEGDYTPIDRTEESGPIRAETFGEIRDGDLLYEARRYYYDGAVFGFPFQIVMSKHKS